RLGGATGDDLVDARRRGLAPVDGEDAGEDDEGEDEIGDRASGDDRRALPDILGEERVLAVLVRHAGDRVAARRAGGVLVAEELHIAAERNGRDLPARAVPVVEADQFRPEADRERLDSDATPAGDEEMAQLVKEDD